MLVEEGGVKPEPGERAREVKGQKGQRGAGRLQQAVDTWPERPVY